VAMPEGHCAFVIQDLPNLLDEFTVIAVIMDCQFVHLSLTETIVLFRLNLLVIIKLGQFP